MPSSPELPRQAGRHHDLVGGSPSKTKCFSPSSTKPSPSGTAVVVMPAAVERSRAPRPPPGCPPCHRAATAPRNRWRCSGLPAASRAGTNCVAVARNGAGHSTRPSCSHTTASSTNPSPRPPSLVGDARAGQSSSTMRLHSCFGVLVLLDHAAHQRDGALALEDGAHRLLQRLLVVGEFEFHRAHARRDHEGVDGHAPRAPHDHGVEVELDQPVTARRGQAGHGQDHVDERLDVAARAAAGTGQQRVAPQALHHVLRRHAGRWAGGGPPRPSGPRRRPRPCPRARRARTPGRG